MKWYRPYLSLLGKKHAEIPASVKKEIRDKLLRLASENPRVSVVVIAHNEEQRLWACLASLADNRCSFPVEFIGVDNLSDDDTLNVFRESGVRYFRENRKGPGYARQCGLDHARGKYYLCIDADTLYPPLYIDTLVKALGRKSVVAVYSLWSFLPGHHYSPFQLWCYETLRDIHLRIQSLQRPELCVRGMVFGFHTGYARKVGFRKDILRGEDGSLALALKTYGKLKFITRRKARAITATTTLAHDGNLWNSLRIRLKKHLSQAQSYFSKKSVYTDEDSNLLKNKS